MPKKQRRFAVALCLVLATSLTTVGLIFAGPSASAATKVSGKWKGPVAQAGSQPYDVKLKVNRRLKEGQVGAKVKYPGLGCRGELVFKKRKGKRFIFRERLTTIATCIDDGKVVLVRKSPKKLKYKWKGSGVRATAVVKRI